MKLAGRHQAVVMQSSDSCQVVVWQLSGSCCVVIRQLSMSHQEVIRKLPGSHQAFKFLGVVHKLRLQEEVGRKSKDVNFYKVETVNEGG